MSVRKQWLLKTDMVDWESRRIHEGSMPVVGMMLLCCAIMAAQWARVVPVAGGGWPLGAVEL